MYEDYRSVVSGNKNRIDENLILFRVDTIMYYYVVKSVKNNNIYCILLSNLIILSHDTTEYIRQHISYYDHAYIFSIIN